MRHPAIYSDPILDAMAKSIDERARARTSRPVLILDPFAGTGKIHTIGDRTRVEVETWGVELMPRWAELHASTICGDATALPPAWSRTFDVVATSPCYGNRMADSHEARDACSECGGECVDPCGETCPKCHGSGLSPRRSYRHDYERSGGDFLNDAPIEKNAGAMSWGPAYRELHAQAWAEVWRVLRRGGLFLLNSKDHVRNGRRVRVSAWHLRTVRALGFRHVETWDVKLAGNGFGANGSIRVPNEVVYVMVKP